MHIKIFRLCASAVEQNLSFEKPQELGSCRSPCNDRTQKARSSLACESAVVSPAKYVPYYPQTHSPTFFLTSGYPSPLLLFQFSILSSTCHSPLAPSLLYSNIVCQYLPVLKKPSLDPSFLSTYCVSPFNPLPQHSGASFISSLQICFLSPHLTEAALRKVIYDLLKVKWKGL